MRHDKFPHQLSPLLPVVCHGLSLCEGFAGPLRNFVSPSLFRPVLSSLAFRLSPVQGTVEGCCCYTCYIAFRTALLLLKMVIEYCQCVTDIPVGSPDIITRLIELLKVFHFSLTLCSVSIGLWSCSYWQLVVIFPSFAVFLISLSHHKFSSSLSTCLPIAAVYSCLFQISLHDRLPISIVVLLFFFFYNFSLIY